jgi:hypothetical protein
MVLVDAVDEATENRPSQLSNALARRLGLRCYTGFMRERDAEADPFEGHGKMDRVARRHFAEEVARKHRVDAGDVEHVLANLTLPPLERLRRSMTRARLGSIAGK